MEDYNNALCLLTLGLAFADVRWLRKTDLYMKAQLEALRRPATLF